MIEKSNFFPFSICFLLIIYLYSNYFYLFSIYFLSIFYLFYINFISIFYLFSIYFLSIFYLFYIYFLSIFYIFSIYFLSIIYPFSIYFLSIFYIFSMFRRWRDDGTKLQKVKLRPLKPQTHCMLQTMDIQGGLFGYLYNLKKSKEDHLFELICAFLKKTIFFL